MPKPLAAINPDILKSQVDRFIVKKLEVLDAIENRCRNTLALHEPEYPGHYDKEIGLAHSILCMIEAAKHDT